MATLALVAIATCAPRVALSQETSGNSETNSGKHSQTSDKPKLSDLTRVSTEEAARQAAKEKVKDDKASSAKPENWAREADQGRATSLVSELQPAAKTKQDKNAAEVQSAKPADSKLKNVHGSVHGATGSAARQSGAEVGASNKSGKTHVYVETGRTENKQPQ